MTIWHFSTPRTTYFNHILNTDDNFDRWISCPALWLTVPLTNNINQDHIKRLVLKMKPNEKYFIKCNPIENFLKWSWEPWFRNCLYLFHWCENYPVLLHDDAVEEVEIFRQAEKKKSLHSWAASRLWYDWDLHLRKPFFVTILWGELLEGTFLLVSFHIWKYSYTLLNDIFVC